MMMAQALGRLPSGVFVLTVGKGTEAVAMLVSWVQQAGFEPPAVTVMLAKGRRAAERIREMKRFGLSMVGEGDKEIMKKYGRGMIEGEEAYAGVETVQTPGGVTVLAGALGWLECELVTMCDFGGDHDAYVGRVMDGTLLKEGGPMVHVRANGLRY